LLEKAFAKFNGTFKSVEAGSPEKGVEALTGYPGFSKETKDFTKDSLWNYLTTEFAAGTLIGCGSRDSSFKYSDGIANGHAYAVLGAYTL
jgi:hypothetical protein